MPLEALEQLRQTFPDIAKDIKLNLQNVLEGESSLTPEQRWGVAIASAIASRNAQLRDATIADARKAGIAQAVIDDAAASAVVMGMNNIYYRFRHMVRKESYSQKRAGLRMMRISQPATNKADLELFSLAVSAIHGCEVCVQSHEKTVTDHGLTEDQVNDAMRIAAVFQAAAFALQTGL
jgi:alkyl hydroperoxide reductase subunit D